MQIHIVRHGEVDYALADSFDPVYRGARADFAPLSSNGIAQVKAAAAELTAENPRIVASPYTRTMQTAAIIAQHFGRDFSVDLGLHDALLVRRGDVGYSHADAEVLMQEYRSYRLAGSAPAERSWESDDDIRARLFAVIRRNLDADCLILVAHEAVVRVATGAEDVPLASVHRMATPETGEGRFSPTSKRS